MPSLKSLLVVTTLVFSTSAAPVVPSGLLSKAVQVASKFSDDAAKVIGTAGSKVSIGAKNLGVQAGRTFVYFAFGFDYCGIRYLCG